MILNFLIWSSYSINYERQLFTFGNNQANLNTGVGGFDNVIDELLIDRNTSSHTAIPLSFNTLFFKGASHLEIDFSTMFVSDYKNTWPIINVGYKFKDPKSQLFLEPM